MNLFEFVVKRTEGVFFEKDGIFKVIAVAGSGFTSINKWWKDGIMMKRFALDNDYTYKYIKTDKEEVGQENIQRQFPGIMSMIKTDI